MPLFTLALNFGNDDPTPNERSQCVRRGRPMLAAQKRVSARPETTGNPPTKRRPEGRPLQNLLLHQDQLAALLAGLSIAALSPVAGALALTLTPCSRSAAIFNALSSLASGGT